MTNRREGGEKDRKILVRSLGDRTELDKMVVASECHMFLIRIKWRKWKS